MTNRVKRPSVHDVARHAGVSIGSVSRALNGGVVSPEMRARILAAVSTLDYRPNAGARSMRSGKSRTIGCLVNNITNPLFARMVNAIEKYLWPFGYTLLLANSNDSMTREIEIMRMFEERGLDGAIVSPSFQYPAGTMNPFSSSHLPLVVVDRNVGVSGDHVYAAHRAGSKAATRHLLMLGHQRIVLLTSVMGLRPGIERLAGYRDAFEKAGVQVDERLIRSVEFGGDYSFEAMRNMLESPSPPTAVLGVGTQVLSGALRAVREKGLNIPRDFSVVAIGEADLMEFANPRMTTVKFDVAMMGEFAAKMLMRRLASDTVLPPSSMEISMDLLVRESCGPCLSGRDRLAAPVLTGS